MAHLETDERVVHRWEGGMGWITHPDEMMQRASQAIVGEEGVWLVDPLDMDGLDEVLASLGDVAGVVVLLDRHTRDAEVLAKRYDVPVALPESLRSMAAGWDVPVVGLQEVSSQTPYAPIPVVDLPGWREYALYDAEGSTAIFADALGTASYFLAPGERIGVHPMLRMTPPRDRLREVMAERVLVGHGPGLMTDGTAALHDALAGARRRAPRVYLRALGKLPRIIFGPVRR